MKNFSKNTFNKKPRRIHRNAGGRKKGTLKKNLYSKKYGTTYGHRAWSDIT